MRGEAEARLRRDEEAMGEWYPAFTLIRPFYGSPFWYGAIKPFRSSLATFRIVIAYLSALQSVPKVWIVDPEVSKRTYPFHPHLNADGSACTFFVPDGTYDPVTQDITRLLDLVSDWLRKHIHRDRFDWWPGEQAPHEPADVLEELRGDRAALCICGSGQRFEICCRSRYMTLATAIAQGHAVSDQALPVEDRNLITHALRGAHARLGTVALARLLPHRGPSTQLLSLGSPP